MRQRAVDFMLDLRTELELASALAVVHCAMLGVVGQAVRVETGEHRLAGEVVVNHGHRRPVVAPLQGIAARGDAIDEAQLLASQMPRERNGPISGESRITMRLNSSGRRKAA